MRVGFIGLALGFAALLVSSATLSGQQGPGQDLTPLLTCLHDESASVGNQARRRQALTLARAINSAQAVAAQRTRLYQPLAALAPLPAPPAGFTLRFYTDGEGYIFSLKDERDPCRFGFFSDQDGVIHEATPIAPLMAQ